MAPVPSGSIAIASATSSAADDDETSAARNIGSHDAMEPGGRHARVVERADEAGGVGAPAVFGSALRRQVDLDRSGLVERANAQRRTAGTSHRPRAQLERDRQDEALGDVGVLADEVRATGCPGAKLGVGRDVEQRLRRLRRGAHGTVGDQSVTGAPSRADR